MYYIYAYIDPRTNLPFYIGKGKDDRKYDHLKETDENTENKEKHRIIEELKSLNLTPTIIDLETDIENEDQAYLIEDHYILMYGRRNYEEGGILTNKTIGGKHPPVPIWDDNKKKQHSNWNKSYWTEERRNAHPIAHSIETVSVTDKLGNSKRIPKKLYDGMINPYNFENQEYVPVASKEAKRRRLTKSP